MVVTDVVTVVLSIGMASVGMAPGGIVDTVTTGTPTGGVTVVVIVTPVGPVPV